MSDTQYRRWLHRWAVLTASIVFPLVFVGSLLSTLKVGMADPMWPTPPWYLGWLLWTGRALEQGLGFLIEHAHRQLGWVAGACILILAVWIGRVEERRWLRRLGWATLATLIIQGVVLGGLRVLLVDTNLAMVHGCVAHLIFAMTCCLAVFTSRNWCLSDNWRTCESRFAPAISVVALVFTYVQVGLGALLRHVGIGLWLHAANGIIVLSVGIALAGLVRTSGVRRRLGAGRLLALVLPLQAILGLVAWATSSGFGLYLSDRQSASHVWLATAHVAVGTLTMAATAVLCVSLHLLPVAESESQRAIRAVEAAA